MQNKNLLLLMLGASYVVPAYSAMNVSDVQVQIARLAGQVDQYQPLAKQLIDGNFNALQPQLQSLDLRPFIGNIQQYLAVLKTNLPTILNKIPMDMVPANYQADVKTAIAAIKNNMGYLDTASTMLNNPAVQKYFNIGAYSNTIINGLNAAKNSPAYTATIKPALQEYYSQTLQPAFDYLTGDRITAMKNGVTFIENKIANPNLQASLDDISNIAVTFGVIRRLITIISGLSHVALSIDNAITQAQLNLPSPVHDALSYVETNANKIEQQVDSIAQQLKKAVLAQVS